MGKNAKMQNEERPIWSRANAYQMENGPDNNDPERARKGKRERKRQRVSFLQGKTFEQGKDVEERRRSGRRKNRRRGWLK